MKAKLAKKLVSSLAASAILVSVFAACDLGLTPFVAPVDSGAEVIFDAGNTVVDAGTVDAGSDAGDAGDASTGPKRVFVTSQRFAGDFNGQKGQAGADAICQTLATTAKLNSRFVSWISETTAGKGAIDHINDVGPWYLPDRKTLVFASKASIQALPMTKIDTDETGSSLGLLDNRDVWTGTTFAGQVAGPQPMQYTCSDWTSASNALNGYMGDSNSKNAEWTQSTFAGCNQSKRIYCFEQ